VCKGNSFAHHPIRFYVAVYFLKKLQPKAYDHHKEQGKKAFHFEVANADVSYFKFLSSHARQLRLEMPYFGKFAKFTGTMGNNAPMSDCTRLHQCIQGHLNFYLSSTCITINGIDVLDTSELLCNPVNGKVIGRFTLRDIFTKFNWRTRHPLFTSSVNNP
jgi:hypothetical protein